MIIELYLWRRVFQIRYRRQSLYEIFVKTQGKKFFRQEILEPIFVFKLYGNIRGSAVRLKVNFERTRRFRNLST